MFEVHFGTLEPGEDAVEFDQDGPQFDSFLAAEAFARNASRANEVWEIVEI